MIAVGRTTRDLATTSEKRAAVVGHLPVVPEHRLHG
jgi:hypothetical protein